MEILHWNHSKCLPENEHLQLKNVFTGNQSSSEQKFTMVAPKTCYSKTQVAFVPNHSMSVCIAKSIQECCTGNIGVRDTKSRLESQTQSPSICALCPFRMRSTRKANQGLCVSDTKSVWKGVKRQPLFFRSNILR